MKEQHTIKESIENEFGTYNGKRFEKYSTEDVCQHLNLKKDEKLVIKLINHPNDITENELIKIKEGINYYEQKQQKQHQLEGLIKKYFLNENNKTIASKLVISDPLLSQLRKFYPRSTIRSYNAVISSIENHQENNRLKKELEKTSLKLETSAQKTKKIIWILCVSGVLLGSSMGIWLWSLQQSKSDLIQEMSNLEKEVEEWKMKYEHIDFWLTEESTEKIRKYPLLSAPIDAFTNSSKLKSFLDTFSTTSEGVNVKPFYGLGRFKIDTVYYPLKVGNDYYHLEEGVLAVCPTTTTLKDAKKQFSKSKNTQHIFSNLNKMIKDEVKQTTCKGNQLDVLHCIIKNLLGLDYPSACLIDPALFYVFYFPNTKGLENKKINSSHFEKAYMYRYPPHRRSSDVSSNTEIDGFESYLGLDHTERIYVKQFTKYLLKNNHIPPQDKAVDLLSMPYNDYGSNFLKPTRTAMLYFKNNKGVFLVCLDFVFNDE